MKNLIKFCFVSWLFSFKNLKQFLLPFVKHYFPLCGVVWKLYSVFWDPISDLLYCFPLFSFGYSPSEYLMFLSFLQCKFWSIHHKYYNFNNYELQVFFFRVVLFNYKLKIFSCLWYYSIIFIYTVFIFFIQF